MEQITDKSAQNLGIAALITGIITLVMAVIPCIGVIAIIPGIVTIILASVGLGRAYSQSRGILIASLIIGIVATMIGFSQIAFIGKVAKNKDVWGKDFRNVIEDVRTQVMDEIDKGDFSIRIESGGEVVEIKSSVDTKKREEDIKKLEKLEGVVKPDTTIK